MSNPSLTQLSKTALTLEAKNVRLEPLSLKHSADLFEVGKDEAVWQWLYYEPPASLAEMQAWIQAALDAQANGLELPFAVLDKASGQCIGTTRLMQINPAHRSLEIGWTWYGRAYWRTAVNTECKYLLLQYAFESLGCTRVQLKTDLRNERSQRAIERLGATREGVLRKERIVPKNGYHRSSVCYSIIDDDWPEVKARLISLLRT